MMDVRPIHNEQDYDWANREVPRYLESEPESGTAYGDRFEVLSRITKINTSQRATARSIPSSLLET
jgi:HTH-type transcriptional regulator/antitoxin HigA